MESFYFLIPIALIFVAIALRFLFWAIHTGQYDNLDTEAHRILFDEDKQEKADVSAQPPAAGPSSAPVEPAAEPIKSPRTPDSRTSTSQPHESSHD